MDGVFCSQGNAAEGYDDEDDHLEIAQVDDVVEQTPNPAKGSTGEGIAGGASQEQWYERVAEGQSSPGISPFGFLL